LLHINFESLEFKVYAVPIAKVIQEHNWGVDVAQSGLVHGEQEDYMDILMNDIQRRKNQIKARRNASWGGADHPPPPPPVSSHVSQSRSALPRFARMCIYCVKLNIVVFGRSISFSLSNKGQFIDCSADCLFL
jgi:hypothetical protein